MTALQLKYFGPKKRKAKKRKNPIRTREGRVLRVEGHNRHESSELLLTRKKQKKQHKRRTRRIGNLTYQTAEYVLRRGPKGSKSKRRRSVSGTARRAAPRREADGDLFQFMSDVHSR